MNKSALSLIVSAIATTASMLAAGIFFARRYRNKHPTSKFARPVSTFGVIVSCFYVALYLSGFAARYIAPNSALGRFTSDPVGLIAYMSVAYLATVGCDQILKRFKRGRIERHFSQDQIRIVMSELIVKDGVDPWRDELGNLDQTAIAPVCRVRMFDDKVTSMEFVVSVLHKCCGLSLESAITGMFTIHNDGQLIVASLSELSAQRLVAHITEQARKRSYPLRCDIEAIVGQGRTPT